MKTKTCEDLIDSMLAKRIKEIKGAMKSEKRREEFEGGILAISKSAVYKIELSYGGPQDYFTVEVSEDGQGNKTIESIQYHYLDWFDGAARTLVDEDFKAAEECFSSLLGL